MRVQVEIYQPSLLLSAILTATAAKIVSIDAQKAAQDVLLGSSLNF